MFSPEELRVILEFLERSPVTGRKERQAMNIVVAKLESLLQPKPAKNDEES